LLLVGLLEDVLQIRRLAAKTRAVVHDFAVNLAGCEIDKAQWPSSKWPQAGGGWKKAEKPVELHLYHTEMARLYGG
jgi:hypothetical protein